MATDVAGTMTWVPFGLSSSDSLAVPAGQIASGSRFGVSADPTSLLAGNGNEFTVWDTQAQRAGDTFTATRTDHALPVSSTLDHTATRVALGYADGTVEVRDAHRGTVTVEKPQLVDGTAIVSFAGDALVVSTSPTNDPAELVVVAPDASVRHLWRAPAHRRVERVRNRRGFGRGRARRRTAPRVGHGRKPPAPRARPRCDPRVADRVQRVRQAAGGR